MEKNFDCVIVGAGIVGLAHAFTAAKKGLTVAVIERDHRCVGASIRNFGFITVTGQSRHQTWERALKSRDTWRTIAPLANIAIVHQGLWVLAKRKSAQSVLEAFARTDMGDQCELMLASEAATRAPFLKTVDSQVALYSPHELRVESRQAIPKLTEWLEQYWKVQFFWGEEALQLDYSIIKTHRSTFRAERVVLCTGTELKGIAAPALDPLGLQLTRLQMLRVQGEIPGVMNAGVMSDLSLVRYAGYADLPESNALKIELEQTDQASLSAGIHLIAVRSEDGSLVVGDSHHTESSPWPFAREDVDALILKQLHEAINIQNCRVLERWTGVYPVGGGADCVVQKPDPTTRVVSITSGTGASTAFAIAQEVFDEW
jgi:D-hydroxyproline dehydrogenase subunit beta